MFDHNEDKMLKSGQTWHGAAIGWHQDLHPEVAHLPSNNARLSGIKLSTNSGSILTISLYAPTSGKDDEFLECITDLTEYILSNFHSGDSLLIGTDSNCSTKSTPRRQACWMSFIQSFSLFIHSTGAATFHHNNGFSESSIDFFLSSKNLKLENVRQLCTLDFPLNLSSHDPLLSSVRIAMPEKSHSRFSHTYSNFNLERIIWDTNKIPEYQNMASQALSQAIQYWNTPETTPLLCSLLPSLLVKCAKLVFQTKTMGGPRKFRESKAVLRAEKDLTREHRKWKRAGKPLSSADPDRAKYVLAKSNLQRIRRYEDNLKAIKDNNNLMHCNTYDRNKVYSKMKYLRGAASGSATSKLVTPVGTYHDEDVLEGFAADAEHLGKPNKNLDCYDNYFYNLCILDNLYIFELKENLQHRIPPMSLKDLDHILHKKMKLGKSCDIYHLTVEHLRECGPQAKSVILSLINKIIQDIYYLTCSQAKTGLGTAVHKGKNKPVSNSKSYRRITVTPLIGAILDKYVDPVAEAIFRKVQSPDQLGFTADISYLMGAVIRGECQRWARDKGVTCFGVSLDGEAAFPSVEREIQVRELYSVGERGDYLKYSRNTYQNTECYIKLDGKLSRKVAEYKGQMGTTKHTSIHA